MRLRAPRPRIAAAAIALGAAAVALPGCSGSERAEAPPTYHVPAERAREGESVPRGKTGRSADLHFTVLGFREGMTEVMGTHTAMGSKGTFTRVRVLAVNTGRDIQVFDTWKQRLVTTDGRGHSPDVNATMIKRQPERLSVGASMRVEFDLWFDVPRGARVRAVLLYGSPPVGAVGDPDPTEIRLP
ncbi:uncharacterized protein DUF4352 [Actinomadura pelletieri DSM 43383]|uniref:Uncharacterized protein DUF4352 n=1 Tax=Actinomadura pelletieri DSM 43383 TaxID=1120940 RepID=A0A495QNE1_9ACTN|nr:DUF4352 domain-containing protein [Actinomadura pelletieri]RKS74439.1 uncharacterized protein DUF4352 [Actinomadura pelletieri DSM 43383]